MWNDQPPTSADGGILGNDTTTENGHCTSARIGMHQHHTSLPQPRVCWRGVPRSSRGECLMHGLRCLLMCCNSFWLTHSVPLFPSTPAKSKAYAGVPTGEQIYAQVRTCRTFGVHADRVAVAVLH